MTERQRQIGVPVADAAPPRTAFPTGISRLARGYLPVVSTLWRRVGVPFVVSRLLIFFPALFLVGPVRHPDAEAIPLPAIGEWLRLAFSVLVVSDSGWYLSIIRDGYAPGPFSTAQAANWAFFPLYPLLANTLAQILPLSLEWSGIILSNLALLVGLAVLDALVSEERGERAGATAVWLLALFPTSYFLSGFRPEAVFLLISLLTYREARQGRWWSAGALGALAALARPQGALIAILILAEGLRRYGWHPRRLLPPVGAAAITGVGTALFMAYLGVRTGNPLAFRDILVAWGHDQAVIPGSSLVTYLAQPYLVGHYGWDLGLTNVLLTLVALIAGAALLLRREYGVGCYVLANLVVALAKGNTFISMGRYVLVLFPIYALLAAWLCGRGRQWREATLAASAALLALLCLLVALGIHAAQG